MAAIAAERTTTPGDWGVGSLTTGHRTTPGYAQLEQLAVAHAAPGVPTSPGAHAWFDNIGGFGNAGLGLLALTLVLVYLDRQAT